MTPVRPSRIPAGWLMAAACLASAIGIDLSRYHESQHADSLIPILVSLYQWEPFYWGQNRLGMLVPLLATPFSHPFANLLVQNGLNIFGALAGIVLIARYFLRDQTWVGVGTVGVLFFLLAFPDLDRFHVLNGSQPYLVPLALALAGMMLATGGGRWPVVRWIAAIALTLLAYWVNAGLAMMMAPLAVGRFACEWWFHPSPSFISRGAGWRERFQRAWANLPERELILATALIGLGTVAGSLLGALYGETQSYSTLIPADEWTKSWRAMAENLLNSFGSYLKVLGCAASVGLLWLVLPATRFAAVRGLAVIAVSVVGFAALFVFLGTTGWVRQNDYSVRYLFGNLIGLAPAVAALLVGPPLAWLPRAARGAAWLSVAILPLATAYVYGPPSIATARAAIEKATSPWTADIFAGRCTHVGGDYWAVWPAVFHCNMALAERGEARIIWGVAFRSNPTYHQWSRFSPEDIRIGVLTTHKPDIFWEKAYPGAIPVEVRPTLTVHTVPEFAPDVRVGSAAVELEADDNMVIAGCILPGKVTGADGKLRAVAVVIEKPAGGKVAIVACDVIMLNRDLLDPVVEEVAAALGIPQSHVLVNCTHTHHAPSTVTVHGYSRDEIFCKRVQRAIVKACKDANAKLKDGTAAMHFRVGEESSVGQNSRQLLKDKSIYWIGPRDDFVRPTGPFDPELPVISFRSAGRPRATLFNHSTHTIGVRKPGRSPSFYGLAAQELEAELGGEFLFLEGASGSTHNLGIPAAEATIRMKSAVKDAMEKAKPRQVDHIAALKRAMKFKVRTFDEEKEDAAVATYCTKYAPKAADDYIRVFRDQRKLLAPKQGEERSTWVQAVVIGEVAIVGVPAEFFTVLGQDIKRRSPFRYTYVAELANDWIGYLPDKKGHELGGYQTWMGLHSFAEVGTGERVVNEAVKLLEELAKP